MDTTLVVLIGMFVPILAASLFYVSDRRQEPEPDTREDIDEDVS